MLDYKVRLGGRARFDIANTDLQELMGTVEYYTQCCGFGFGYQRFNSYGRNDNEFRVSVSLKNVGTVFQYDFGGNDGML